MKSNQLFHYLAISDQSVCPEPVPDRIRRLLELGVPAIQIRDKSRSDRTRLRWARDLPSDRAGNVLINSRADIAVIGGLDGVHRSGSSLSTRLIRRIAGTDSLVGASTHEPWEIRNAQQLGADYVCFGPIFPTPSKPDLSRRQCVGLSGLADACSTASIPVFALGGVTPERVGDCVRAGAHGAAGIRALFQPEDPAPVWKTMKEQLP